MVVTRWWAGVISFGGLALLLLVMHAVLVSKVGEATDVVSKRRRGVKTLVIGSDGRASTSKVQAVLWTFAVLFAFLFLLVWGRSIGCEADTDRCLDASDARLAFHEVVERDLQPEYFVLLGLPLSAALAAKALTTGKVEAKEIVKQPLTDEDDAGVVGGIAQVVANDSGETDFNDFQYFAFNLLTLSFFLFQFLTRPWDGLPDIPPTLLALAGVSTATYTAKKALDKGGGGPAIASVVPRRLALSDLKKVTVIGGPFDGGGSDDDTDGLAEKPFLCIDGYPLKTSSWTKGRIDATVTAATRGALADDKPTRLHVVATDATASGSAPFTLLLDR